MTAAGLGLYKKFESFFIQFVALIKHNLSRLQANHLILNVDITALCSKKKNYVNASCGKISSSIWHYNPL
jgi:hypothetical protein